jgi:predicted metal-dependent peptidase
MNEYDYNDPCVTELVKARTALLYIAPLLGELSLQTDLVICENNTWIERAATDGRSIYFYRGFIISLFHDANKPGTRMNGHNRLVAILAHEMWHIIFGHLYRRGNRDPEYWGMAIDYVVNAIIKLEKTGLLPARALLDPKFTSDHTAYEVYDYLVSTNAPKQESLDKHIEPLNHDGGDGDSDEGTSGPEGSEETDVPGIQKMAEAGAKPSANGDITVISGDERPAPISKQEAEETNSRCRLTAMRALSEGTIGSLPGVLAREISDVTDTSVNWREVINSSLRSMQPFDFSYDELSDVTWASWAYHRKHWTPESPYTKGFCAILPSQSYDERVEAVVALDTSASMTNGMISQLLGTIGGVMETYQDFHLHLLCFDEDVLVEKIFTRENISEFKDFKRTKIVGGSGTNFKCVWDFMKARGIKPDRLIICTDGLPGNSYWGDARYCETIFAIYDKKKAIKAPFGKTVHMD